MPTTMHGDDLFGMKGKPGKTSAIILHRRLSPADMPRAEWGPAAWLETCRLGMWEIEQLAKAAGAGYSDADERAETSERFILPVWGSFKGCDVAVIASRPGRVETSGDPEDYAGEGWKNCAGATDAGAAAIDWHVAEPRTAPASVISLAKSNDIVIVWDWSRLFPKRTMGEVAAELLGSCFGGGGVYSYDEAPAKQARR